MQKTSGIIIEDVTGEKSEASNFAWRDHVRMPQQFKHLNQLVMRDLNDSRTACRSSFSYTKEDILKYLNDPLGYESELRKACVDIYTASSHFRRLIQYFTMLTDWAYVISPTTTKAQSKSAMKKNFDKVMKIMESFQVRSQFPKILSVCLREDVYYGTLWVTEDNITIQRLPQDYCKIASIEGNVFNVDFDFSFFDSRPYMLQFYPVEFQLKYQMHRDRGDGRRWIRLDSPTSFAVKCTSDIDSIALPPFAGILPEVYDLDDYKRMKLTRTELENYAILVMKLGMTSNGEWSMDLDKARDFWMNLEDVLPDAVGSVLQPMSIEKISFDRTSAPEANSISEATNALFGSAGVSNLLFNGDKASSNALLLSIKNDQGITYGIVQSICDVVNRYIQQTPAGKNFKVSFLNTSVFNRDEVGGQYLKMCNVGMPMVQYLAATYGMTQSEMVNMNYLEDEVLGVKQKFVPLQSSSTMASATPTSQAGRPEASMEELSDSGETHRERDEG